MMTGSIPLARRALLVVLLLGPLLLLCGCETPEGQFDKAVLLRHRNPVTNWPHASQVTVTDRAMVNQLATDLEVNADWAPNG